MKDVTIIIMLSLICITCAAGLCGALYESNQHNQKLEQQISNLEDRISSLSQDISLLDDSVRYSQDSINTLNEKYKLIANFDIRMDTMIESIAKYQSMDMLIYAMQKDVPPSGLYYGGDSPELKFYCVWPEYYDPVEVSKTEAHEYCHYLIDNESRYDHFCS